MKLSERSMKMGFLFFKSKKEKEREERREKRHALRRAESTIEEVTERIKRMEKEADADWARAREASSEGKQAAAQRALTAYRAAHVMITKLEQKKWVFRQVLMKLETAGTDAEFAKALKGEDGRYIDTMAFRTAPLPKIA